MKLLVSGSVVWLALVGASAATSERLERATEALERQDYETAVQLLKPLARKGNDRAQLELARLYLHGRGVERDPAAAVALLERADDSEEARYELAGLRFAGDVTPRDLVGAFGLATSSHTDPDRLVPRIVEAATAAERTAMARIVDRWLDRGWYLEAGLAAEPLAARGVPAAQFALGRMRALAYGLPQDLREAFVWLSLGRAHRPQDADRLLAAISPGLSPAELAGLSLRVERWTAGPWNPEAEVEQVPPPAGTDGVTNPTLRTKFAPEYPEDARVRRLDGVVVLSAIVTADGGVESPHVLGVRRPGFGFEESALAAVANWRYEPATRNGEAVAVTFTIVVEFKLH